MITDAGVKNIKDFESPDVTQPISKWKPHGQNPRADLWYVFVVLSMCIYEDIVLISIVTTVLVSIVASGDRPDRAGVVERVQHPGAGVQLGPSPPETHRRTCAPYPWSPAG